MNYWSIYTLQLCSYLHTWTSHTGPVFPDHWNPILNPKNVAIRFRIWIRIQLPKCPSLLYSCAVCTRGMQDPHYRSRLRQELAFFNRCRTGQEWLFFI